jgi:hypothetical protein
MVLIVVDSASTTLLDVIVVDSVVCTVARTVEFVDVTAMGTGVAGCREGVGLRVGIRVANGVGDRVGG